MATFQIKIENILKLQKKLEALPPVDESQRQISRVEAVTMLAPQVMALQKRGYSLEMISEVLSESGVQIASSTLKTYLSRSSSAVKQSKRSTSSRKTAKKRDVTKNGDGVDPVSSQNSKKITPDETIKTSRKGIDEKYGRFTAKPDTDDI